MSDIINVDPKEYGLESKKAQEVSNAFRPMLDKMVELEKAYNAILKKAKTITPEVCEEASSLRKEYVKVRTGTAKIHKELKDFYLQGGRFVDGWKNAQKMSSQGNEEKLREIEEYFDRIEAAKIVELQNKREAILRGYDVMPIPANLGAMDDVTWEHYETGCRVNYETLVEAAKKAEAERLQKEAAAEAERQRKEKEEAERRKKIEKENERLQKEAIEREAAAQKEREKLAAERKEAEAKASKERESAAKKLAAEQKAKKEAEDKIREIEAQQKREADEAEAKRQLELSKGDAEKVKDLIHELENLKKKYTFEAEENVQMYSRVKTGINAILDRMTN